MNTEDELRSSLQRTADGMTGGLDPADVFQRAGQLRRRQRGRIAAAAAVAAVLLVAVPVALAQREQPVPPSTPAPSVPAPTVSSTTPSTASSAVVADPASELQVLAVSPTNPDVMASTWRRCDDPCQNARAAVAVTTDGFSTRAVADLPIGEYFSVVPAGDGFLVTGNPEGMWLLATDGSTRPVGEPGEAAPLADGEMLHWDYEGALAVDPRTAASHRLTGPDRLHFVKQAANGDLHGTAERAGEHIYAISSDGGATWRQEEFPVPALSAVVESAGSEGRPEIVRGGDGATLFPLESRFDFEGRRLRETKIWGGPGSTMPFGSPLAVLPDGDLLLAVESWSDATLNPRKFVTPPGLYRHSEADGMQLVGVGTPFDDLKDWQPHVVGVTVRPGEATIHVQHPSTKAVWRSTDAGQTWTEVRVR